MVLVADSVRGADAAVGAWIGRMLDVAWGLGTDPDGRRDAAGKLAGGVELEVAAC